MKSNLRRVLAIFTPIVVVGLWIGYHALGVVGDGFVRLPVSGIDPRDLLSGHYLIYRVDYGAPVDCSAKQRDWCLCMDGEQNGKNILTYQALCSTMDSCARKLRGNCLSGRFDAGIEQFFFPEEHRQALAVVPPDSSIVVALTPSGRPTVKDLLVGDIPVFKWLAKRSL